MSNAAKSAKSASPQVRGRRVQIHNSAPVKNGGARILTREELMARIDPIKPGQVSAHDFFHNSPLRKFNLWLIKNGHPEGLGELDQSLCEGSDA